ncbi:Nup93/Nic96-domain-containing protein [Lentinula lateritia]|nr:Nup93/Nic96-domain-containing protein [Lentinula lateritia]
MSRGELCWDATLGGYHSSVFLFTVLANITQEPPSLPPKLEHASAYILNSPVFAKAYLTSHTPAISLRKQIASGARQALEEQYLSIIQRTVHSHPSEAQLGGDPSTANRLELVKGTLVWAQVFFLVRVGEVSEAFQVLMRVKDAVDAREPGFIDAFRIWADSTERSLPRSIRDQLAGVYNAHMLQAQTTDPFKLALYKLVARLDVGRRSIPNVTTTTEDWLWMQFAMVDESSADHPSPPGVGREQLEAAWELVRRIIVMANGGPMWEELVGGVRGDGTRFTSDYKSQILLPTASSLLSNDRLTEAIKLYDLAGEYDTVVGCLAQALGNLVTSGSTTSGLGAGGMTWSATGDQQDRTKELEKTAREILTVYERLGRGTGLGVSGPSGSNTGGKDRDACVKLLKILEASERGRDGHVERALEIIESTALVPLDVAPTSGKESEVDVMTVTKKAEEFTQQHEALQRCLPVYLVLCMDALSGVASKIKSGGGVHAGEAQRHATLAILRKKSLLFTLSILYFPEKTIFVLHPGQWSWSVDSGVLTCKGIAAQILSERWNKVEPSQDRKMARYTCCDQQTTLEVLAIQPSPSIYRSLPLIILPFVAQNSSFSPKKVQDDYHRIHEGQYGIF